MAEEDKSPSSLPLKIWWLLAGIGTIVGAAMVGMQAAGSESAGVQATYIVAFPLGFLWSGALASSFVHLSQSVKPAVRVGVPVGCGCLGGAFLLAAIFMFFVAIWPSL